MENRNKNMNGDSFSIPDTKKGLKCRGIFGNTQMWLQEKAEFDTKLWGCPQKCWIVQNKMYDLEQFAKTHPGGEHWIRFTKGHQITQLFRVHHLDIDKARNLLDKFYIGDCPRKHPPRFDFDESGLFETLRKRILDKFTIKELTDGTKTNQRWLIIFSIWIALLTLTGITKSYLMAIICGMFMVYFYGMGHTYIHKRPNWFKHSYLAIGFSADQQTIMHCLSHHVYTNTLLDYEYAGFQPIAYFPRCLPSNSKYSIWFTQLLFLFISFANIVFKVLLVPFIAKKLPSFQYFITLLQWAYLSILTGDLWLGFKLFAILQFAYGFTFGLNLPCQHREPKLWSEGSPENRDFILHQIATTYDLGNNQGGLKSIFFFLGFNIHVLHHIFPTIDLNKLPQVEKIFENLLQERGYKLFKNKHTFQCNKNFFKSFHHREPFNLKNITDN